MNVLGFVVDVTCRVWNCMLEQQFEEKLDELRALMGQLKTHRNGVMSRVDAAEVGLLKRTPTVDAWLQSFDDMEKDVTNVLQEGTRLLQKSCICVWCPWNCWTNQKFGKKVVSRISLVNELRNRGDFQDVAERLTQTQVQEVSEDPNTVGLDSTSASAWNYLQQDGVKIVGLYGLGGVGKTTLLKRINNTFLTRSSNFDIVIWVVVSKKVSMERVQTDIGARLGLPWLGSENMRSRSQDVFNMLQSKKFLILLDDIWERLDLSTIGVPVPNSENKSKIMFTTRSEIVCGLMEADEKIRVQCLNLSQAWELFVNKVGVISDPEIQPLAEIVAKECAGLPLVLIVIGRAMASKKTRREWEHAITVLQNRAESFAGMQDEVFSILKFSYDSLPNDSIRSCFLFCSIYPEDHVIKVDNLVKQWIGEGYIDEYKEWDDALNAGYDIVGILKSYCLLEPVTVEGALAVKMHDVLRDMAHWIEKYKILVITDVGVSDARMAEKMKWAQSITIWVGKNVSVNWLGDKPACPNATTFLFLCDSIPRRLDIPDDFFLLMPALKFVDFIDIRLVRVPTSICRLEHLEYLSLSRYSASGDILPREMMNLIKLKYLYLCQEYRNNRVPVGVIGRLSNLQVLQLDTRRYGESNLQELPLGTRRYGDAKDAIATTDIQELGGLNKLISLDIRISTAQELKFILTNQRLLHHTTALHIGNIFQGGQAEIIEMALSPLAPMSGFNLGYLKRLSKLSICHLPKLKELELNGLPNDREIGPFQSLESMSLMDLPNLVVSWGATPLDAKKKSSRDLFKGKSLQGPCFRKLHHLEIIRCDSMVDMRWLLLAPHLQSLTIEDCAHIGAILSDECEESAFSNLRRLRLSLLRNLSSICSANDLPFPSLEEIEVVKCPKLINLSLDCPKSNGLKRNNALNNLKSIRGPHDWWMDLQWKDYTVMSTFDGIFQATY